MRSTKTIYVATSNAGKLRDFAAAAEEFAKTAAHDGEVQSWQILPLPRLSEIAPPPEDEDTFEGNARVKAIYYSQFLPGEIVLADDSGLEVDALKGAPGVHSARYAERAMATFDGETNASTDQRNNRYLLDQLASALTPMHILANLDARSGRYRCVLCAACDGLVVRTAEGTLEGNILLEPDGDGGFGYDPLFYLPQIEQTIANVDMATRISLSHRGVALRQLLSLLASSR